MAYALWRGAMPGEGAIQSHNGQLYNNPYANMIGAPPLSMLLNAPGGGAQYGLAPLQVGGNQAPAPTPAPKMDQLQPQYNKLTEQARNALYGGLLGYQAPALTSGGSNPQSFAAPQGGFRFPFGLLNQG